jgi:hypothetical protein
MCSTTCPPVTLPSSASHPSSSVASLTARRVGRAKRSPALLSPPLQSLSPPILAKALAHRTNPPTRARHRSAVLCGPPLSTPRADAPTTAGAQGSTPLYVAASNKKPAAAERLVEEGADVKAKSNVRPGSHTLPYAASPLPFLSHAPVGCAPSPSRHPSLCFPICFTLAGSPSLVSAANASWVAHLHSGVLSALPAPHVPPFFTHEPCVFALSRS